MNVQNCQTLQQSDQPRLSSLSENSFYLACLQLTGLFDSLRQHFANQSSLSYLSRLSVDKLRDTGLDDPRQQMKLFNRTFESEISLRKMNLNQLQLR
jgi:hypothetical protein